MGQPVYAVAGPVPGMAIVDRNQSSPTTEVPVEATPGVGTADAGTTPADATVG